MPPSDPTRLIVDSIAQKATENPAPTSAQGTGRKRHAATAKQRWHVSIFGGRRGSYLILHRVQGETGKYFWRDGQRNRAALRRILSDDVIVPHEPATVSTESSEVEDAIASETAGAEQ